MKNLNINMIFLIICTFFSIVVLPRSVHRPIDNHTPYIVVTTSNQEFTEKWTKQKTQKSYTLHSDYLQITPLFTTFDKNLFEKWTLPVDEAITFRQDSQKSVKSKILSEQAEVLIEELRLKKKKFTYFTILKDRDFNYRTKSGLIVLKYKHYPFVIKILIEHPQTFVDPFSKSIETGCLFIMGGSLRHLNGFTRIPNLHVAREILYQDKTYKALIDFPRKWFWSPKETAWLNIKWKHSLNKEDIETSLPSIYGVICDLIIPHEEQPEKSLRRLSVEISNHLNFLMDAHDGNAIREKDTDKIVIIDTEHFPTMSGLNGPKMHSKTYFNWLIHLIFKFLKTKFCRNKNERSKCYDERYWDKSLSINSSFLSKT